MAKNKGEIKLNKKHNGKEFVSKFQYVGVVKPVQKKDEQSDNWYNVEISDITTTRTNKPRKVTQFVVETAYRNNLKVEVAGMEMGKAFLYSQTEKRSEAIDFADRHNKSKYPNESFHLIDTDWDKAEKIGKIVKESMWVDVKGHFEFSSFETDDGKTINMVKRIIDNVVPLKNGSVEISECKKGDTFRAYDEATDGNYLGQGKADENGVATVNVGWLNPEGGKLYVSKVNQDKSETKRIEVEYTDTTSESGKFKVYNNLKECGVRVDKIDGSGYEYKDYVMDFRDEKFHEINSFEMQIGIKSTYQDETTKDTKVNGVFLSYGKEKSQVDDVELDVFYEEPNEGYKAFADSFANLNPLDFLMVYGVDNNRAEFTLVEVQEAEDDNPFADVQDKVVSYEQAASGTKKGLEIKGYIGGTYTKELLTEDEVFGSEVDRDSSDPFGSIEISSDDLPF